MQNVPLKNFGYIVIQQDLKRLKKYTSLEEDLDKFFKRVNKPWIENGAIIDSTRLIYAEDDISFYKGRCPVLSHNLSPSEGVRVIYTIIKRQVFVPFLLFSAKEETNYPLRICKAIIKERLRDYPLP